MRKFNKILLIDDDDITNFINTQAIKGARLSDDIKITLNGNEAINYLKNICKDDNLYPDLIIIDINMPAMDGFEFLKEYEKLEIKEKPLIIMLTTSSAPRDLVRTANLGIKLLNKPMTAQMLEDLFGKEQRC